MCGVRATSSGEPGLPAAGLSRACHPAFAQPKSLPGGEDQSVRATRVCAAAKWQRGRQRGTMAQQRTVDTTHSARIARMCVGCCFAAAAAAVGAAVTSTVRASGSLVLMRGVTIIMLGQAPTPGGTASPRADISGAQRLSGRWRAAPGLLLGTQ